jgi:hypothetical protein
VLPFEVQVLIVEGQGGELSLTKTQGGGETAAGRWSRDSARSHA